MKRIVSLLALACGWAAVAGVVRAADVASPPRERLRLDLGWRFHLGNEWGLGRSLAKAAMGFGPASAGFSDASWRPVDLPHDWAVELPFDAAADGPHGFKPVGPAYPQTSVAWYRRTFTLPAGDAGRRLWLEFDGAYRDATVFVNGWFVGRHEGGYNGFRFDISAVANCGGKNVVAVLVDASQFEGWFYEGAGIHRHVWLVKTAPLAIAPDGVFVFSRFPRDVPDGPAEIHLATTLDNSGEAAAEAVVNWEIVSPNGAKVGGAQCTVSVGGGATVAVEQTVALNAPQLWAPESPRLYRLITSVVHGGKTVDRVETEFGVRTIAFDADRGFLLNGNPYVIKGTCNHEDHAGVGIAVPDRLQYFRIARLKEMGANAYRAAHNPASAVLEACDRLGMLVLSESRSLGADEANLARWADMIRRERNHPSVILWSVGNEEFKAQDTPAGARAAAAMQTVAHRLDPTRLVTYAAPNGNRFAGVNGIIDVRGWNYHVGPEMDAYHAAHPHQPEIGSEQASTLTTRGIYARDPARGYMSAYDDRAGQVMDTAKAWWSYFDARPWLSGGFVWSGFDYRGEPTPYGWPNISSHFGVLDTCGFAKDNFWYYQSWWTQRPVLHLLPHWNWPGREGQEIDVRALSNCTEVELLLNGRSLGRQSMPRAGELQWRVPYTPGVLSARGFSDGQLLAETKVETTGAPAAVQLAADSVAITADGEDVAVVTIAVVDAQGRIVPTAGDLVSLELTGPGQIIGVGNGDPSCHEPDVFVAEVPVRGTRPLEAWRCKRVESAYAPNLPEEGASVDEAGWAATDIGGASGTLGKNQQAVFRTTFVLSAEELATPAIELQFGRISGGDYFVYVNGQLAGSGGLNDEQPLLNVTALLHEGANTVAVGVANWNPVGGISGGVRLRWIGTAPPVAWRRSVFNGLAQVIVRASQQAGVLELTARAPGLQPATISIPTKNPPP